MKYVNPLDELCKVLSNLNPSMYSSPYSNISVLTQSAVPLVNMNALTMLHDSIKSMYSVNNPNYVHIYDKSYNNLLSIHSALALESSYPTQFDSISSILSGMEQFQESIYETPTKLLIGDSIGDLLARAECSLKKIQYELQQSTVDFSSLQIFNSSFSGELLASLSELAKSEDDEIPDSYNSAKNIILSRLNKLEKSSSKVLFLQTYLPILLAVGFFVYQQYADSSHREEDKEFYHKSNQAMVRELTASFDSTSDFDTENLLRFYSRSGIISGEIANVRESPDSDSQVILKVPLGTPVFIKKELGESTCIEVFNIYTDEAVIGWIETKNLGEYPIDSGL